jgi:peptidyl-prolyl cis-trans isomerase SurA
MKARLFSLVLIMSSVGITAQINDPVIMKINDKGFKKSEFEYFYNKYNNEDVIDKRSLNDYIDLFKNLKLKVAEAEAQGMDTTASFMSELSGYRSTEAKSYMDTPDVNEELVRREYDRMKDLVEISHIMITFSGVKNNNCKTLPSDTLEAYNKAVQIRIVQCSGNGVRRISQHSERKAPNLKIAKVSRYQNDRAVLIQQAQQRFHMD